MLVDGGATSSGLAVQEVTRAKKTIYLGNGLSATDLIGKFYSPTGFTSGQLRTRSPTEPAARLPRQAEPRGLHYGRLPVRLLLAGEYRAFHQGRRGRTVGDVKVPLGTTDFSGALLQARASGAKVVGFANADADLQNCIKQSAEFGIVKGGQELATLLMFVTDVVALGQDVREGLMLTNSFYWDLTPKTRAWTERFVNLPCSAPRDVIGRRAPP